MTENELHIQLFTSSESSNSDQKLGAIQLRPGEVLTLRFTADGQLQLGKGKDELTPGESIVENLPFSLDDELRILDTGNGSISLSGLQTAMFSLLQKRYRRLTTFEEFGVLDQLSGKSDLKLRESVRWNAKDINRKLHDIGEPSYVHNIRSEGYMLKAGGYESTHPETNFHVV